MTDPRVPSETLNKRLVLLESDHVMLGNPFTRAELLAVYSELKQLRAQLAQAEPVARVTYSNWNGMSVEVLPTYPALLPVGTLLCARPPSPEAQGIVAWLKSWWQTDDTGRATLRKQFGPDVAHLLRGVADMIEDRQLEARADEDGHCTVCGLPWPDERETLEPHVCPPGFRPEAQAGKFVSDEVLRFLHGSGPLDGQWFGDKADNRAPYWWRKYLPAAPESEEPT